MQKCIIEVGAVEETRAENNDCPNISKEPFNAAKNLIETIDNNRFLTQTA